MGSKIKNHEFKCVLQSEWIVDLMKELLPDDGFLVEIGVGHVVSRDTLKRNFENPEIGGSHTAELIGLGWSGIYIDPIEEFCREATFLFKNDLTRVRILNYGASDQYEICTLYGMETLIPNAVTGYKDAFGAFYRYPNRRVLCKPTTDLLYEAECPKKIDFMIIDTEGFEEKVLRGLDFQKYEPKILFIENDKVSDQSIKLLLPDPYMLVKRDNLNSCFVNTALI